MIISDSKIRKRINCRGTCDGGVLAEEGPEGSEGRLEDVRPVGDVPQIHQGRAAPEALQGRLLALAAGPSPPLRRPSSSPPGCSLGGLHRLDGGPTPHMKLIPRWD